MLTDIVDADSPLLMSKAPIKKCSMQLDFENGTVKLFGSTYYTVKMSNWQYWQYNK